MCDECVHDKGQINETKHRNRLIYAVWAKYVESDSRKRFVIHLREEKKTLEFSDKGNGMSKIEIGKSFVQSTLN